MSKTKRTAHFLVVLFAVIVKLDWNDHGIVAALWSSLHPIDDIDVDRRDFHWFRRKYPYVGSNILYRSLWLSPPCQALCWSYILYENLPRVLKPNFSVHQVNLSITKSPYNWGFVRLVKMCAAALYRTEVSSPSQYIKMPSSNKAGLGPFTCLDGTKFVLLTVFTRRFALRFG